MGFRTSFEVLSTNNPPITHWSCRAIDHILIGPYFLEFSINQLFLNHLHLIIYLYILISNK